MQKSRHALFLQFLCIELTLFYLKFILWLPPTHPLIVARMIMLMLAGSVAVREAFQYVDDPYVFY